MSPCLGSKKRPPKKTRTCHKKWVNQWLTNRHAFPKVFVYFMLPHLAWRKKRKRSLEQKHLRRAALHCTRKPWDIYLVSRESSAKWRADGVIRIRQLERRGFWVVYKYYQSNFGSRGEIKGGIIYVCVCVCECICMCLRVSEREGCGIGVGSYHCCSEALAHSTYAVERVASIKYRQHACYWGGGYNRCGAMNSLRGAQWFIRAHNLPHSRDFVTTDGRKS